VVSTGASNEQLDMSAELDQGAHLFSLQARYQDQGDGQDDYYLAGSAGVSHQPLRDVFGLLGDRLATSDHANQTVLLSLETDPRSTNPERFDEACTAFTDALGPYLLKSSDLPEGKAFGELAPDELAALQRHPLVVASSSECTGDQLPVAEPAAARPVAASEVPHEHWMADLSETIGPAAAASGHHPRLARLWHLWAHEYLPGSGPGPERGPHRSAERWQPGLRRARHVL
jgi:hypothetical protein